MSKRLIDIELLEKLERHFSKANNIYLGCFDRERNMLTSGQGTEEETEFFKDIISREVGERLFAEVEMSQVEAIVEKELDKPYAKLCGVINRINGSIALVWVAVAVIEEKITEADDVPEFVLRTTEEQFYRSIAFLETLTKQIFRLKEHEINAEEAMKQAIEAEEKYKDQLYRSEAMARVVRLIEMEESFEAVCEHAVREVCDILHVEGGAILHFNELTNNVEFLSEYCQEKNWSLKNRLQDKPVKEFPFFDGKPYMLSSDSMMRQDLEKFFKQYHLNAGLFQPIEVNGRADWYLCFYEFEKDRIWDIEDIKFVNDVKRVLHGIFERGLAKDSFAGSYAALESVLEHVDCAIYVVDYDNKEVLYTNQKFRELVERDVDKNGLQNYFFSTKEIVREFPSQEVHLPKHNIWLDMSQVQLSWIDGRMVSLGTIYDITDKKLYQLEIERQISNDNLTGLYNRMRCEKDLEKYIKEAEENGAEGAFLCMDIDDFQNINDGLGHQYGDTLLKAISHNLSRISGIEDNCYRISGDEFGIIVHGENYKHLSRICKDLRTIFERPWFLKNEDFYCTMSMGIVCFPTDGNNVDDLTRKVDMALAAAKKKGKNCVEFYNEKVEDTSFYRLDLEQNMRRATLNSCNEFEVYYQPIMQQGKQETVCCGAEALVRWNSTELGFIPPADFIPLAEYLGLINPIGEHVLYEAVKRCKYWNDCGHPEYKVNVNISVIQLLQPDFVAKIKQVIDKVRINPKNVTLEVTESLAINDMDRMKRVLKQLKALGVCVALDDFGTGYSSLNHIRQMPIDVIKIDRCFVENLSEDEFAGAFVKMVSELASTIGVAVCVEGVEQRKQLEALKDMNVKMVQGYYYGKPMPVAEFEKIYL